jgi:hypothetical protein
MSLSVRPSVLCMSACMHVRARARVCACAYVYIGCLPVLPGFGSVCRSVCRALGRSVGMCVVCKMWSLFLSVCGRHDGRVLVGLLGASLMRKYAATGDDWASVVEADSQEEAARPV